MTARLPDEKFYTFPEEEGACMVRASFTHSGGACEFYLVRDSEELRQLVSTFSPRTRVEIADAYSCFMGITGPTDCVYVADKDGSCRPGAY
jgi:hypothetical protein